MLYVIDCALRWSETCVLANKQKNTTPSALKTPWVARWTPPKCIVSDGEGTINSHEGRLRAERQGIQLKNKPTGGIGASTVERHHELFRQSLHRIKDRCAEEGEHGPGKTSRQR